MPIEFRCSNCDKLLRTPDESAGKKAKCPQCGSILPVPAPNSTGAAASPFADAAVHPFASEAASGPWGATDGLGTTNNFETTAGFGAAGAEAFNPYQSPAPTLPTPTTTAASPGALQHGSIALDTVFSQAWGLMTSQLGQCLLAALVIVGILIGQSVVIQIPIQVAVAMQEPVAIIVAQVIAQVIGFVVGGYIGMALLNFSLKLARTGEAQVGDIFAANRHFPRVLLLNLLLVLIVLACLLCFAGPAGLVLWLMGADRPEVIIPVVAVCVLPAVVLITYLMLRFFLARFLVVDQGMRPLEALSASSQYMRGNKLIIFVIQLVLGVVSPIVILLTCCIGLFFYLPFGGVQYGAGLVQCVAYLMATGQPIFNPQQRRPGPIGATAMRTM